MIQRDLLRFEGERGQGLPPNVNEPISRVPRPRLRSRAQENATADGQAQRDCGLFSEVQGIGEGDASMRHNETFGFARFRRLTLAGMPKTAALRRNARRPSTIGRRKGSVSGSSRLRDNVGGSYGCLRILLP